MDIGLKNLFLAMLDSLSAPEPVQEYRFHVERLWRFDFCWPEHKVALEVEGGVWKRGRHNRPKGFIADCEKYNAAAADGWRVFRYPTEQVSSGRAAQEVAEVLLATPPE